MPVRPEILSQQDALTALCRRFHVRSLEVFGSAASDEFDPQRSDVDFLVEFEELAPRAYADAYFGLLRQLEQLFGRPVDLVMPSGIRNKYLLRSINRTRTPIYAA